MQMTCSSDNEYGLQWMHVHLSSIYHIFIYSTWVTFCEVWRKASKMMISVAKSLMTRTNADELQTFMRIMLWRSPSDWGARDRYLGRPALLFIYLYEKLDQTTRLNGHTDEAIASQLTLLLTMPSRLSNWDNAQIFLSIWTMCVCMDVVADYHVMCNWNKNSFRIHITALASESCTKGCSKGNAFWAEAK